MCRSISGFFLAVLILMAGCAATKQKEPEAINIAIPKALIQNVEVREHFTLDTGDTGKPPVPFACPHDQIRIRFEVDGRQYEAVGFLRNTELNISGEEMFNRVPDAIGEEDWSFLLLQHMDKLPAVLRWYALATNRKDEAGPGFRSVLRWIWGGNSWCDRWRRVDHVWDGHYLVLRRVE